MWVELAAEPWGERDGVVGFARETGYDAFYLWGVEWWYYRRTKGDSAYWDRAQELMSGGGPSVADVPTRKRSEAVAVPLILEPITHQRYAGRNSQ